MATVIDDAVLAWFQAHRHPAATQLMLFLSLVHSNPGLLGMAGALGLWVAATRQRLWFWALVGSVPGAMLLNVGAKHLFARERPDDPMVLLETYSFPSGHATGSAAFYTFLAFWVLSRMRSASRVQRAGVIGFALAMTLMVCVARMYLGVHYLTDVLAGMLLGTAWTTLWVGALRRQAGPNVMR